MADPEYTARKVSGAIPVTDVTLREMEEDWLWVMGVSREEFARRMSAAAASVTRETTAHEETTDG